MHYLICSSGFQSIILDDDILSKETITSFPWHMVWRIINTMAFLTTHFRVDKQRLSATRFRHILNMEPATGWSPLCLAARCNSLCVLQNLTGMGADVDFHGSPLGPAIFVAIFFGCLDAVRFLVQQGASTFCFSEAGVPVTVVDIADYKHIRNWLLVGRFNERQGIKFAPDQSSTCHNTGGGDDASPKECLWSGIVQVPLIGISGMERQWKESTLDCAARFGQERIRRRGKVVSAPPSRLMFQS